METHDHNPDHHHDSSGVQKQKDSVTKAGSKIPTEYPAFAFDARHPV